MLGGVAASPTVLAQSPVPAAKYTALEPLPCIPDGKVIKASDCPGGKAGTYQSQFDFRTYIQFIYNLAIALAAATAIFMIVFHGLKYMTTESWTGKGDAISKIKEALVGLLLILSSYLILRTVDPRLVAIPTTLVKPLSIEKSHALDDFFDDIQRDLALYHQDMQTFKGNREDALKEIGAATSRLANINQQIRTALGDQSLTTEKIESICRTPPDSVKSLCQDSLRQSEAIYNNTQKYTYNEVSALMRATVQHCGTNTSEPECWTNIGETAKISNLYSRYTGSLAGTYNQDLTTYYQFAKDWFAMNGIINSINNGTTYADVNYSNSKIWNTSVLPLVNRFDLSIKKYSESPNVDSNILKEMQDRQKDLHTSVDQMTQRLKSADATKNRPPGTIPGYLPLGH